MIWTCISLITKNAQCNQMVCFPFCYLDIDFLFVSTLLNSRKAYSYPKLPAILYHLGNYWFMLVFFSVANSFMYLGQKELRCTCLSLDVTRKQTPQKSTSLYLLLPMHCAYQWQILSILNYPIFCFCFLKFAFFVRNIKHENGIFVVKVGFFAQFFYYLKVECFLLLKLRGFVCLFLSSLYL